MSADWRNLWSSSQQQGASSNLTEAGAAAATPDSSSQSPYGQVVIEFGSSAFLVNLPQPDSQLRVLKAALSDKTGLRPDEMTLTCGGFKLKDDNAPLKVYGIYPGQGEDNKPSSFGSFMRGFKDTWGITGNSSSQAERQPKRLLLRADPKAVAAQSSKQAQKKNEETEAGLIEKITKIRDSAVEPFLPKFEAVQQTPAAERKEQDFLILNEGLLQALLKLDGIEVPSMDWQEARKCRKESVKKVQGYLDQVDQMREEQKQLGAAQ